MDKIKNWFKKIKDYLHQNPRIVMIWLIGFIIVGFITYIILTLNSDYGPSIVKKVDVPLIDVAIEESAPKKKSVYVYDKKELETKGNKTPRSIIKFKAQQVLVRENLIKPEAYVKNKIKAVLVTSVDTRDLARKVQIRTQNSEILPEGSLVFATARYSKGDRVFFNVESILLPDGKQEEQSGRVLDLKQKPGLTGEYFSGRPKAIAATMGLALFESGAEVLTEKESRGDYGVVTTKSSFRNAVLKGGSDVSGMEKARIQDDLSDFTPYVLIPEGSEIYLELYPQEPHE